MVSKYGDVRLTSVASRNRALSMSRPALGSPRKRPSELREKLEVRMAALVFEIVNGTPPWGGAIEKVYRGAPATVVGATSVQVVPLRRQNLSGRSSPVQKSQLMFPLAVATVTVTTVVFVTP